MGMTMTQKILSAHAGLESVCAGQLIEAELDLVLGNDITSPVAIHEMEKMMWSAVEKLDFEKAAELRDIIQQMKGDAKIGTNNKNYRRKAAQSKKHKRRNSQK